ncbi:hypothetical protein [Nocardia shimofusensis]|uniref:hypothetical protein n=1 Tax=Nocardia shimofusensis TaxID=228596 RepID=UPI000B04E47D|nr:hypothetical protein [Nocardia shimofusensis]
MPPSWWPPSKLMLALGESVAATARPNGWSPLSAVSAELERVEPSWLAERWGYTSTIQ